MARQWAKPYLYYLYYSYDPYYVLPLLSSIQQGSVVHGMGGMTKTDAAMLLAAAAAAAFSKPSKKEQL